MFPESVVAKAPVAIPPQTAAIPWQPKTSKVSASYSKYLDLKWQNKYDKIAPIAPIGIDAQRLTKPLAGVIATKPHTAPQHQPIILCLLVIKYCNPAQANPPAHAAI